MTNIIVFSKPGCGKCDSAKSHIKTMGFEYEERLLSDYIGEHEGWRTDGSIELLAWCAERGDPGHQLPTIKINEEFFDFSAAMKVLKTIIRERKDGEQD